MWGSFRDVADDSGAQLNAAAIDAQPAATFEDVADHVFIGVNDLLGVRVFVRTEGDQTAGKSLFLKAVLVANLIVEFGKPLERGLEVDDFHLAGNCCDDGSNVLNDWNDWNWFGQWFQYVQHVRRRSIRFGDRRDDFADRLFRFVVGDAAGADNPVAAPAVSLQQLADVDLRCRIENIVAHRDRRGVGSLGVVGDFDLNISLRKQRENEETVAIRDIVDAPQISVDHIAFQGRTLEQDPA